mmetsp:Transcript_2776/g.5891  ORF Transcript_2776/g.5891 Transcript_2776/m.5891 type:complete len:255 (-) Transcript_2776:393-1157(-)
MANPQPPTVKVTLLSAADGAQVSMTSLDRPRQQTSLLVAAVPTLRIKLLGNLPPQHPTVPPVVDLLRHRHRRDVISVKLGRVLPQVREDHPTAAGVASPPPADSLEPLPLLSSRVVEVGRGGYANPGEGSAGSVAGRRERGVMGAEDGLVRKQAEDAYPSGMHPSLPPLSPLGRAHLLREQLHRPRHLLHRSRGHASDLRDVSQKLVLPPRTSHGTPGGGGAQSRQMSHPAPQGHRDGARRNGKHCGARTGGHF